MKWSVIVVAKGMWPVTEICLDSIKQTFGEGRFQIIYIDNDTPITEDSWARSREWENKYLRHQHPVVPMYPIQRYQFPSFVGLAEAWNFGIGQSVGERILICNNDIEFLKSGWREEFDEGLDTPGVGAVGLVGMSWRDTPFIQGCLLAFTRETFNKVGEFDTQFEFTCEDVDWCKRMQAVGLSIKSYEHLRDNGTIRHGEGTTRNYYKDSIKEMQRLAHISRINFCYKYTYPDISIHD